MKRVLGVCAPVLLVAVAASPSSLPTFTEKTAEAGITFSRSFGDHDLSNIVEGTGSGVCVFDYDGDGRLDLYFPNGRWEQTVSDNRGRDLVGKLSNALYRNDGDGTFTDVTAEAGVRGQGLRVRLLGGGLRRRRRPGSVRPQLRPQRVLPQQRRRDVHRRLREVGPRRPALEPERALVRLRRGRRPRRLRGQLPRVRRGQVPLVLRRRRLPGSAELQGCPLHPLPQQRRRHLHRRDRRRPGCGQPRTGGP